MCEKAEEIQNNRPVSTDGNWFYYPDLEEKKKKYKMRYKVIYMPRAEGSPKDKIFNTYEEACKYIEQYACKMCRKAVKQRYLDIELDYLEGENNIDRMPIRDILDTPCGAEWMIEEEK